MESKAAPLETGLKIADAAQASGVSVHTLRYYERAGLIDAVDRAASGHRRCSEDDLAWVEVLRMLGGRPGCRSAASAATRSWCGPARPTTASGWRCSRRTGRRCGLSWRGADAPRLRRTKDCDLRGETR